MNQNFLLKRETLNHSSSAFWFYWVNQIRTDIVHYQKMTFFQIKLQLIYYKTKIILPKTGIEPILNSYKESVLPIKLFRLINFYLPWNEIESLSLLLQRSALTVKPPRLHYIINYINFLLFLFLIGVIVFWKHNIIIL